VDVNEVGKVCLTDALPRHILVHTYIGLFGAGAVFRDTAAL